MNLDISDEDLIVHVLNNLTEDYEAQLMKLEDKLSSTTNPLTIKVIRAELRLKYVRMQEKKDSNKNEDAKNEKVLAATGKFKGTCSFCGKYGHKATVCQAKINNKVKKDENHQKTKWNKDKVALYNKQKCFYCKKPGHKQDVCVKKKANQTKGKANNNANDASQAHAVFVTTEGKAKTLTDATWIADSGATCHVTNDKDGMYDTSTIYKAITIGNGETVQGTLNGKIDMRFDSAEGTSTTITLTNVKFIPCFWGKLFSLTCAM